MSINQTGLYSGNLYQIIEDIAALQTENAINKSKIEINKTNIQTNTEDIDKLESDKQNKIEDLADTYVCIHIYICLYTYTYICIYICTSMHLVTLAKVRYLLCSK